MSDDKDTAPQETPASPQEQPTEPAAETGPGAPSGGFDIGTVISQARQVITDPTGFYRGMPKSGGFSEPLIFALVMGAVSGAVFGVLSIIGLTGAGFAGLGAIIAMPIGLLIGSFIGAAILFVIWKLMGSPENYQTAYRCIAYYTAIMPVVTVISVIPYLGTIVRTIWGIWLVIIASVEVHGRSKQTAQLVFGILGAIGLIMGLSAEHTQRNFQAEMSKHSEAMEQHMKSLEKLGVNEDGEIDPEKVGNAVGSFMKGIEEAARRAEESAKESDAE